MMGYEMEELVPIVGKLAKAYTAGESTSVTYEKAEQMMGAVLYAIGQLEQPGQSYIIPTNGVSAQQAYEMGMALIEEKVKTALRLYNEILPVFSHYENQCLYDTFVRRLPLFFKRYDIRFEPQNSILALDYPVLKDISRVTGIDQIYEFIRCIHWEQRFLRLFPRRDVMHMLSLYNRDYREMAENVCEGVLWCVSGHILAGKPFAEMDLEETDYGRIGKILERMDQMERDRKLRKGISALIGKEYENEEGMVEYFCGAVDGLVVRLKYFSMKSNNESRKRR